MTIVATAGILGTLFHFPELNFTVDINEALPKAVSEFLFGVQNIDFDTKSNSWTNILVVTLYTIFLYTLSIKELFIQLDIIIGIVSLFAIVFDFETNFLKTHQLTSTRETFGINFKQIQRIYKLSQCYNQAYGILLLSFFVDFAFSSSLALRHKLGVYYQLPYAIFHIVVFPACYFIAALSAKKVRNHVLDITLFYLNK